MILQTMFWSRIYKKGHFLKSLLKKLTTIFCFPFNLAPDHLVTSKILCLTSIINYQNKIINWKLLSENPAIFEDESMPII